MILYGLVYIDGLDAFPWPGGLFREDPLPFSTSFPKQFMYGGL